jgi:HAD superfamily hydrolase (TIGR01509 family)
MQARIPSAAPSAVIFDLDGLLIDSEPLHCACWMETLSSVGVELDVATYADHWTRAGRGIEDFCQERGVSHDPLQLRARKSELYQRRCRTHLQLMPGARECLERLMAARTRLALATAGFPEAVTPALAVTGLRAYFETVVTRVDVTRHKPAPDAFLLAAERLGVPPGECVVLEDAEKGVRAAHAAGMRCIAIPTDHTRGNDFSLATLVLPGLAHVTPAVIGRLMA